MVNCIIALVWIVQKVLRFLNLHNIYIYINYFTFQKKNIIDQKKKAKLVQDMYQVLKTPVHDGPS